MSVHPFPKPPRTLGDKLVKATLLVGVTFIAFLPTEILVWVYHFSDPTQFWQKFAVIGLGIILGGSVQILLLIAWVIAILSIREL